MNKAATTPGTSENSPVQVSLVLTQSDMAAGQKTMEHKETKPDVVGDELLTSDEAAAFYKVTLHTLKGWRLTKKGPRFVRVGNGVRYWRSDLLAFIQDQG